MVGTILKYADISTLKALRLVDRTISQLATPLLFQEVYLGYLQSSFSKLRCITRSGLAKHVRSMVYMIDLLPYLKDQDTWWDRVSSEWGFQNMPLTWLTPRITRFSCALFGNTAELDKTKAEKAQCWKLYRHYYYEQQELVRYNADQTMLAAAFPLLPSIDKIEICTTRTNSRSCHPFWTRLMNETLYSPALEDNSVGGYLFKNLLMALSWNNVRLKQIDTQYIGSIYRFMECPTGVPLGFLADSFTYLRKLTLELDIRDAKGTTMVANHLAWWLSAAKSFEELTLGFMNNFDVDCKHLDNLKDLISMQWPNLKILNLTDLLTTEDTLLTIIGQQPSLEDLTLNRINLNRRSAKRSGLWLSFFRRLSTTKGASLKSAKFHSLIDKPYPEINSLPINDIARQHLQRFIRFGGEFPDLSGVDHNAKPPHRHSSRGIGDQCDYCRETFVR